MKKLIHLSLIVIFCYLLLLSPACKKSTGGDQKSAKGTKFHFDNSIGIPNYINRVLYFAQSAVDAQQLVSVGSTAGGPGSYGSTGFNLINFDKSTGIKSMYSYISDSLSKYPTQIANCVDQDNNGNLWIGGYATTANFGKPYVVKLDNTGKVAFSTGFVKKENAYNYKPYILDNIKVLKNGDVLLLLAGRYDVQAIRMKSDGSVIWNKQYTLPNADVFILAQGHNSFITENAAGDIFFLSNVNRSMSLTRLTPAGDVKYNVSYQKLGYGLYVQLKFLSSGELLLSGQNGISYVPFIIKINPDNGYATKAVTIKHNIGNNTPLIINDIIEANGELKAAITVGNEYDIFTLNNSFDIINSTMTLARSNGAIATAAALFDGSTNELFHLVNAPGPASGSFLQFLRTDIKGLSCQGVFDRKPVGLTLPSFDPGIVKVDLQVTDEPPNVQAIKFVRSNVSVSATDACGK